MPNGDDQKISTIRLFLFTTLIINQIGNMGKEISSDVVSTVTNTQCLHIDDLIRALLNVDEIYYTYTTQKMVTKYPERVFAYELYHQYRKIMEEKPDEYNHVYLNGEQQKSKQVVENLERCAPDLVLHNCIFEVRRNGQFWLCEIKMKGNPEAMSDLEKFYKMESLGFKCYIFLYAGVTYKEMVEDIRKIKINTDTDVYEKTICISTCNRNGMKQIHCHGLKEIVESEDNLYTEQME